MGQFGRQKDGYLYGIEVPDPAVDLWGVDSRRSQNRPKRWRACCWSAVLPEPRGRAPERAGASGFETNRGVARHCKTCGVPSIWTQAPHEDEKKLTCARRARRRAKCRGAIPAERRAAERAAHAAEDAAYGVHSAAGADDELAVCEDISPIGMCFRSKRRYERNTPIDVAVPYSPDAANIFLPARVVYSEEMPKAGLFRHGTEYRRVGPRAR